MLIQSQTLHEGVLELVRRGRPECVRAWFGELRFAGVADGALVVRTANDAQRRYLETNCRTAFTQAAQAVTQRLIGVRFETESAAAGTHAENGSALRRGSTELSPDYRLDQFAVGECNRLAHAAAVAVAADPGGTYNPLVIVGEGGCGKTHLLQGICNAFVERAANDAVIYVSCRQFVREVVEHAESDAGESLRRVYQSAILAAFDDVDCLSRRARSQEEFFHILEYLLRNQRQVVVAMERPLEPDSDLEPRLVSRFKGGLVVTVEAPCVDVRTAILRGLAVRMCVDLPQDVADWIVEFAFDDGHQLREVLRCLDRYCLERGGVIDAMLCRSAMDAGAPRASLEAIFTAVATEFHTTRDLLLTGRTAKRLRTPRALCSYLALRLTGQTLSTLASTGMLGQRGSIETQNREIVNQLQGDADLHGRVASIVEKSKTHDAEGLNSLSNQAHESVLPHASPPGSEPHGVN